MAIFTFRKKTQPAASIRVRRVKFAISPPQSLSRVRDPRTAVALDLRAPSPFPRPGRPAKQYAVGGKEEREKGRNKKGKPKPYELSARSRYERRDSFKPGDRVMVKDWVEKRSGYVWRHGVVADFEEHPPRQITRESSLMHYPVTCHVGEKQQTAYFSPMRCGILYDRLLSASGRN